MRVPAVVIVIASLFASCASAPPCNGVVSVPGLFKLSGVPMKPDLLALLGEYAKGSCNCSFGDALIERIYNVSGESEVGYCLGSIEYDRIFNFDKEQPYIMNIDLHRLNAIDSAQAHYYITVFFDGDCWHMYWPEKE